MNFTKTIVNAMMTWVNKKFKENAPDWNQNDSSKDGYIKNRPFYSEVIETKFLKQVTVNRNSPEVELNEPLKEGGFYKVYWDGVAYECIGRNYDGYIMLGNNAIYEYDNGIETDTGEPFAMEIDENGNMLYFYFTDTKDHTVSIAIIEEVVKKIDEKYIPDLNIVDDVVRYDEQYLTAVQQAQARANIGAGTSNFSGSYNDLTDKPMSQNAIVLVDQVDGSKYAIQIQNGSIVSFLIFSDIEIVVLPEKLDYLEGEYFDPTGIVVMGICKDGSTKEITEIIVPDNYLIEGMTFVEISCIESGVSYTARVPITVAAFDPEIVLVDFDYTTNADGTYTLTSWKGTLNGTASKEMIIPNNGLIIV